MCRTWRGHFSRTFSCLRARLRKRCVSRIQRWYRHKHAKRMALKMLKQGRDVRIQRVACRWYRLGWSWFRWMKAALLVSSAWRGHTDRTRVSGLTATATTTAWRCPDLSSASKSGLVSTCHHPASSQHRLDNLHLLDSTEHTDALLPLLRVSC